MKFYPMENMSTTEADNRVERTESHSGTPEFSPVFVWHSFCSISSLLCSCLSTIVFFFVPFLLSTILSVLSSFTVSDYLFDIFKVYIINTATYKVDKLVYSHMNMYNYKTAALNFNNTEIAE